MRRFKTVIFAIAVALTLAGPVSAHPGHVSCAGFGWVSYELGSSGVLGDLVRSFAPTGAGVLAGIVADEHDLYCHD